MGEGKGEELVARADKLLKGGFFLSWRSKFEEAADMYATAGSIFKSEKQWESAADAFTKAAECYLKLQSKQEAAKLYISASLCYKKFDITTAIVHLKQGIEFYTDDGCFNIAAKHQKELAELYEDQSDLEKAITAYQTAKDYYECDGVTNSSISCMVKIAHLYARLEKFDKAIELYEMVAEQSINDKFLKWSVKEYFLRAGLCYLAMGDTVGAERALEHYVSTDSWFSSQRECVFLQGIVKASKDCDVDAFTEAFLEYDSIYKLDSWKVQILLKIKNGIKEAVLT